MTSIIIDDDESSRLIIKQLCKKYSLTVKKEFSSAIEAIKYLNTNKVALVFLDIHLPTFSGFDFIKTINNSPKIIITTSDKNYALEAFEYKSVIDYLVKPITQDRFKKSLEKIKENTVKISKNKSHLQKENFIFINVEKRLTKIFISDILLIEAKGDYINIKTDEKNYTVYATLKKIKDKLPESLFLRIHRSFIINTSEIIDIEDNSVLIRKHVVPVSKTYKSELINRLNLL